MKADSRACAGADSWRDCPAGSGSERLGKCDQEYLATITNNYGFIIHVDVDSDFVLA